MIDLRDIGKAGLILQYEDIISMIGFNIAKEYKSYKINDKLNNTAAKDILISYVDRSVEDPYVWLKDEYGIDIPNSDAMLDSFLTMQPSLAYSYKLFTGADSEKINSLYIYSDKYSRIAEESVQTYGVSGLTYIHGDIENFIKHNPNMTLITSSTKTLEMCKDISVPICLVVCDDYLYTMKYMVENNMEEILRNEGNIILRFTSVLSAGVL